MPHPIDTVHIATVPLKGIYAVLRGLESIDARLATLEEPSPRTASVRIDLGIVEVQQKVRRRTVESIRSEVLGLMARLDAAIVAIKES